MGKKVFSTPKPIRLLERVLEVGAADNGLVMDFFAGSGSFAHAVMARNQKEGTRTRCISVQVAEPTDKNTPAHDAGFSSIAEISMERIRRSGALLLEEETTSSWNRDVGFRVLKIDSSNMADVFYTPDQTAQADLLSRVDNIKPDRTAEDLLFQVLLDWGVDLTLPIRRETVQGKTVFFVADTALMACFDDGISEDLVKDLASFAPIRIVFKDTGFADDQTKINVRQIFKAMSPDTEVKAI